MTTKSKIKQEKYASQFPVLTKEDINKGKGRFFFPMDLGKEKDFRIIVKTSKHYVESLFNDMKQIYGEEFKFTIGKTYSPKRKKVDNPSPANPNHWKKDGISDRWKKTYKKEGYTFLIAFVILTKENISKDIPEAFRDQQTLALALEQELIHHFAYVEKDNRIANKTLDTGKKSGTYAGAVIYLAIKVNHNQKETRSLYY